MTRPLTARGHMHAEAFCLMQYACACGHREVIWNSRDGVTPFCLNCPSCGEADLHHVNFKGDVYAPKHSPHHGQRIFVGMTQERADSLALAHVIRIKQRFGEDYTSRVPSIAADFYRNGEAPDLRIQGSGYEYGRV